MRRLARPVFYGGVVAIVFGFAKLHAAVIASYDFTGSTRFAWTIAFAVLLLLTAYGTGIPDLPRTARQAVSSAAIAAGAAAAGMSAVQLVTGDLLLPRFVVLSSAVAVVPWSLVCVAAARGGRTRDEWRDRVLLVADASEGPTLVEELAGHPERPAVVVQHLVLDDAVPTIERSRPLVEEAIERSANLVVLDREAVTDPAVVAQAAALHEHGIRVRPLRLFYEEWLGKLPVSELERTSLLFDIPEVHGSRYLRVKRVVDVAAGAVAVVAFVVAVPFVLVGNVVGNRGPLLYRQERVGKNGRVFTILKLRTMRAAADDVPTTWTQERDPRVTSFGRVLRATHLDELPQALNILKGDLSIVGPRPEQPGYVVELVEKLPFYDMRHLVRPGLTGWAQVKYGYAGSERDALEKLQYEFWYLSHQSLALDARIIGRTLRSVLSRQGRGR